MGFCNTKTNVITIPNQNKGEYYNEPMRTQSKNKQTAQSAGNYSDTVAVDDFNFASDWLKGWREICRPITECGEESLIKATLN